MSKSHDTQTVNSSTMVVRKGEQAKSWFRGDRFLRNNGQWYFTTREGKDVGPFSSQEAAQKGLASFIEKIVTQSAGIDYAANVAKSDAWGFNNYQ